MPSINTVTLVGSVTEVPSEQQLEALRRLHWAANEAAQAFAEQPCEAGLLQLAERARRMLAA